MELNLLVPVALTLLTVVIYYSSSKNPGRKDRRDSK